MITIPKNDTVKAGTTILVLSYPKRAFKVHIIKTNCNSEYYFGYRVMITDNCWRLWPIKYDNGTIAYEVNVIPKYAKKLAEKAFKILEQSFGKPVYEKGEK